jgi:hypothetical protein
MEGCRIKRFAYSRKIIEALKIIRIKEGRPLIFIYSKGG